VKTPESIPDVTLASPDELAFIVVEHYIPKDELPFLSYDSNVNRCSRICGSWVEVLPRLANTASQDSVFLVSMKACAFAIAAYKDPERVSNLDATRVYSAAICKLRRQLAAKSQPFDAELAASIMCLSLAEVRFIVSEACRSIINLEIFTYRACFRGVLRECQPTSKVWVN
jgi:hypothetical protein